MSPLKWTRLGDMPIVVLGGRMYPWYSNALSGNWRTRRCVTGLARRRPSWITADRYGSFSSSGKLGRLSGSGIAALSSLKSC